VKSKSDKVESSEAPLPPSVEALGREGPEQKPTITSSSINKPPSVRQYKDSDYDDNGRPLRLMLCAPKSEEQDGGLASLATGDARHHQQSPKKRAPASQPPVLRIKVCKPQGLKKSAVNPYIGMYMTYICRDIYFDIYGDMYVCMYVCICMSDGI
jgi:hypothetical protein